MRGAVNTLGFLLAVLSLGGGCNAFKVATCTSDRDCAPYTCDTTRGVCVTSGTGASSSSSGAVVGSSSSSGGMDGGAVDAGNRDAGRQDGGPCTQLCGDPRIRWDCDPGLGVGSCTNLGCAAPYNACAEAACTTNTDTDPSHCGSCNRFITARADQCEGGMPRCGSGAECALQQVCASPVANVGAPRCCPTGNLNCNGTCAEAATNTCTCNDGGCTLLRCGDGLPNPGAEQCDDTNMVNDDDCLNSCQDNVCGDTFLRDTEDCDDGNQENGDHCPNTCSRLHARFFAVPVPGGVETFAVTPAGILQRAGYNVRALNPPMMAGQGSAVLMGYQRVAVDQATGNMAFPADSLTPPANTVAMAMDVLGRFMCAGLMDGTVHTFLLAGNSTPSAVANRQGSASAVVALAVHPAGAGCYVLRADGALWFEPVVSTTAQFGGAATSLQLSPVPSAGASLVTEPRGQLLWVLDPLAGSTRPVTLGAGGAPLAAGTAEFTAANGLVALAFDPSGRFVFRARADLGMLEVRAISRTALGTLTPAGMDVPVQGIRQVHVTPRGDLVITTGTDGVARVFGLNRITGGLTWLSELVGVNSNGAGAFVLGNTQTRQVARHAYAVSRADGGTGAIQTFTVPVAGAPLTAAGAVVPDALVPSTALTHPTLPILVGYTSNVAAARGYALGGGTGLPVLSGSALTITHGPEGRGACLGGRLVPRAYVLGGMAGSVALKTLSVDPANGAVTADEGNTPVLARALACDGSDVAPVLARDDGVAVLNAQADGGVTTGVARGLVVHPFGRLVFVVPQAGNQVVVLRRDPATSGLTEASRFNALTDTAALAVDPLGVFVAVYSSTEPSNNVGLYRVDAQTGVVTDTLARASVGQAGTAITFDPSGSAVFVAGNPNGQVFQLTFNRLAVALSSVGALNVPGGTPGPIQFSRQLQ